MKLTGACLPRTASLPLDMDRDVVLTSNFVYLSKEVLKSELYVSSSDVYGIGLLMYEVILERKAFVIERAMKFKDFVDTLDAHRMLGIGKDISTVLTQPTFDLIKACVNEPHVDRPNISNVSDRLAEINGQFILTKDVIDGASRSRFQRDRQMR